MKPTVMQHAFASLATAASASCDPGALETQRPWASSPPKGARMVAGSAIIESTRSAAHRPGRGFLPMRGGLRL